ncbi:MAG: imidazole glycerol phosphate synthase subunit HisH [Cytophagales bacterium]|nr:imidazole glycerol phosphate synthase subunit HisH [Bernardetiaceae bacterium]MDW8205147.1 imidazole glycerol phosphate synthase subunit HisH [Cytophagales bacterium]
MNVAIVKYNAGNTQSVIYALNRLGVEPVVSDEPEVLQSADKVIFPGVGEASTAMSYLKARGLDTVIKNLRQPVLGICIGLQLLCQHSEENNTTCMGIFDVAVRRFQPSEEQKNILKVPQVGWNNLFDMQSPLFAGISAQDAYVYFVHSFYAELSPYTIAKANYCLDFSAALHKDNFYAIQFHAEKSGAVGAKILDNFLRL